MGCTLEQALDTLQLLRLAIALTAGAEPRAALQHHFLQTGFSTELQFGRIPQAVDNPGPACRAVGSVSRPGPTPLVAAGPNTASQLQQEANLLLQREARSHRYAGESQRNSLTSHNDSART